MTNQPNEADHKLKGNEKGEIEESANLERFYTQIKSVPQLIEKASIIDQGILSRFDEIQSTALNIINQFDERRKEILNKLDMWLLPAAKEALDELSHDTEKLQKQLRENLQSLQQTTEIDWIEHAKSWARLYAKWYDNKGLANKVLKLVFNRTTQLIDRDIKVVYDYQNQSLAKIEQENEAFIDIENRLKKATEESLKALVSLKKTPGHSSLKQASDWMATIHKEREAHFDHLLMKIDSIMKDVVQTEDPHQDPHHFHELEGEVAFMEQELRHINELIPNLDLKDERDGSFVELRLNGLIEHLDQFDFSHIPPVLRLKIEVIQKKIDEILALIKKT